jgi:hypothetical protein
MHYKWASIKSNPAAHYLPQFFTEDEERLLYRALSTAAVSTERRGAAAGPLQIRGIKYVSAEQEAVLRVLEQSEEDSAEILRAIRTALERTRDRKPQRAHKWLQTGAHRFDVTKFDAWWKTTTKLPFSKRVAAVKRLRKNHISTPAYATPVLSGTIGFFGRDSQNPWGRPCGWNRQNPYLFQRCLPLIRRIDEAFRLTLPTRYEAQKRFCERLDPRFVIPGTCFTTITVNKNFRTYPHRDSGDLSQGMSNLTVFSNGREFTGGHLVLPEFNVEFALSPRDLLFIANHEYIHENTPITARDADSERMSIVCYAREDLAFCGPLDYEELRRQFKAKNKVFAKMWESRRWYNYLGRQLGSPAATLVEKARCRKLLTPEILTLHARFGIHPLFDHSNWDYQLQFPRPTDRQIKAIAALVSALHFRTPRQDKWDDEDGPVLIDALYIGHDRWALAYCESESGAVKLPNNRFNVQAVGHLPFVPMEFSRLSADLCRWLIERWKEGENVWLVRSTTEVPEAPYKYGLTTFSPSAETAAKERVVARWTRDRYFNTAGGIALRSGWRKPPRTEFYYDLGWAHGPVKQAVISDKQGEIICDAIRIRDNYELEFLQNELMHWRKRAQGVGTPDFQTRYERVGTYAIPVRLNKSLAGSPWKIEALPGRLEITKRRKWKSTIHHTLPARTAKTAVSWASDFQAVPLLGAAMSRDSSLILWRYKDNHRAGQMVATDGESHWLFQAIGSQVPIRKGHRRAETVKISDPMLVGHLQRSEVVLKPDRSYVAEKLRKRAEFIPSPFRAMSPERLDAYGSAFRKGRANVLAIAGEPATGKTFVLRQLIKRASDWESLKPQKLLNCMFSKKLNLYVLGRYDQTSRPFQGTDALSFAVHADAERFLSDIAATPVNVAFEGDRLVTKRFLEKAMTLQTNLAILRFQVARSIKTARHRKRKDSQREEFIRSRETKVDRICRLPLLWDCVEEVRHESGADTKRILKMIDWFLRRSS